MAKKRAAAARPATGYRRTVRATARGQHGLGVKEPGDVFTITDPKHFSEHWMEPAEPAKPTRATRVQQARNRKAAKKGTRATPAKAATPETPAPADE